MKEHHLSLNNYAYDGSKQTTVSMDTMMHQNKQLNTKENINRSQETLKQVRKKTLKLKPIK
jgi:hypothetical protein